MIKRAKINEVLIKMLKKQTFFSLFSADQLSSFQVIVSEMLEDVQERLVYRTQVLFYHFLNSPFLV